MLNHARTLLVNFDGTAGFSGHLGEELLDPDYKQRVLPTYLQTIRSILFGRDPSREVINARARAYMALLHSTELEEFVTELDPRISYDFQGRGIFDNAEDYYFSLGDVVDRLDGAPDPDILLLFKVTSVEGEREPFRTFYNLWNNHHEVAYRLGGLLLAYIYSTDQLVVTT